MVPPGPMGMWRTDSFDCRREKKRGEEKEGRKSELHGGLSR